MVLDKIQKPNDIKTLTALEIDELWLKSMS